MTRISYLLASLLACAGVTARANPLTDFDTL